MNKQQIRLVPVTAMLLAIASSPATAASPECEDLLALYPAGQYEVEPAGGGPIMIYEIWHEFPGLITQPTEEVSAGQLYLVHQHSESNPTCETTVATATYSFTRTEGWFIGGVVEIHAEVEAGAGIVFAKAKTAVGGSLAFNGQKNGSQSVTVGFNSQTTLPPCSAKEYRAFKKPLTGISEASYVEARVMQKCVFGCPSGESPQIIAECGSTVLRAEYLNEMVDPTTGWRSLPPPDNCDNCGGEGGGEDPVSCIEIYDIIDGWSVPGGKQYRTTIGASQALYDQMFTLGCMTSGQFDEVFPGGELEIRVIIELIQP